MIGDNDLPSCRTIVKGAEPYHPATRSGDRAGPPQASACGCSDGAPVYVPGVNGQPLCDLRCDMVRRTVGQL